MKICFPPSGSSRTKVVCIMLCFQSELSICKHVYCFYFPPQWSFAESRERERKKTDKTNASTSKLEKNSPSDLICTVVAFSCRTSEILLTAGRIHSVASLTTWTVRESGGGGHFKNKSVTTIHVWWVRREQATTRRATTFPNCLARQTLFLTVCLETIREPGLNVNGPK